MEKKKGDFVDHIRQICALESLKSTKNLYEGAALFGAASLLAQVKLTDPVEQVKYLFHESLYDSNLKSGWMPWAWLKKCIKENKITELPREDWTIALFINGAYLEGGPEGSLRFLETNNLPFSLP